MRHPRFLNTILGVVIAAAGCGGDQASPLESLAQPSISELKSVSAVLLSCTPLPAASSTVDIGKAGGVVSVGPYTLVVPKGALKVSVAITGQVVSDGVNSVRFFPEGLRFAQSATLSMGYGNCYGAGMLLPKKIVYADEGLNLLEILNSVDRSSQQKVTAELQHFSRYAIAY